MDNTGLGFYLAERSVMFYGTLFTLFFLIFSYFEIKTSKKITRISLFSTITLIVLMSFFQSLNYVSLVIFLWAWVLLFLFIYLTIIFIRKKSFSVWKEKFSKNKKFLFLGFVLALYLVYLQYHYYLTVTGFFRLKHANLLFDSFNILLLPF